MDPLLDRIKEVNLKSVLSFFVSLFYLGSHATGACMAVCGIGVNGVDMNEYTCMQSSCS